MATGVVVMLDALDVRGLWARAHPADVLQSWTKVIALFRDAAEELVALGRGVCTDCEVAAFSDTIILTAAGPSDIELLPPIARLLSYPFCEALVEGIFLRGVVSTGEFERHASHSMVLGEAIDDAAE